ncbi:MAG: insulinase family protein [Lactobacillaceae bacterium]|jgi:predicted Zn-dependent peptidase|nr:insulinase family protein [Lactobacillaceae bacterium]
MEFNLSTLNNGLRIVTSNRPNLESVSLGIWINTGSAYETLEMNGISHFLEHMVFKGTKNYNTLQISEEIEDVGGQTNAYTAREFTAFYAKMLKNDIELALDIIAEFLTAPTFPKDELLKEQEVVIQEIKQSYDAPDDVIFDYMQEKAFPNQAVGRNILGTEESVRSFNESALRKYLKSNYGADNMIVCAAGNVKHDEFVRMVEKRLSEMQIKASFLKENQKYAGGFQFEERPIEQSHVILGFDAVDYYSADYYPCMILSSILGGGVSSRLFQELREKRGLVYTVYSYANAHTKSGIFGIYAGTTNEELKKLIPVVCDEIKKIRTEKVSEKELERAKTQFRAGMRMALESSSATAEIMTRQLLLFNRIIPIDEMVENINSVTTDDIRNIADKIFSSNPTYNLIGAISNHPDYEKLKKWLKK